LPRRFAESYAVGGLVLVSACVTDLGDENERLSGYYNRCVCVWSLLVRV
jgi:uncharacterized protein